jgi:hypothetical protein
MLRESLQADGALSRLGRGTPFFWFRTGHMPTDSSVVCHRMAAGARTLTRARKRVERAASLW